MPKPDRQVTSRYPHAWWPSSEIGIPVDRCRCGVMRNADGSNDDAICINAVRESFIAPRSWAIEIKPEVC